MNAAEFSRRMYHARCDLLNRALDNHAPNPSYVASQIQGLNLDKPQADKLRHILSALLTDAYFSILMGLDGAAPLGGTQEMYAIYSEAGILISSCGELEAEAYADFVEKRRELEAAASDFTAELYLLKPEEGGRSVPAYSGYRPDIRMASSTMLTGCRLRWIDTDTVYPGETATALMDILPQSHLREQLIPGARFDLCEGPRKVASGRVLCVRNPV